MDKEEIYDYEGGQKNRNHDNLKDSQKDFCEKVDNEHDQSAELGFIDILANFKYGLWKAYYGIFYNYEEQDLEERARYKLSKT